MGRQPAALDLLGVEGHHVADTDSARDRRGDRDEPVARVEHGLHAARLDVAQKYRLSEVLPDDQRGDDEHGRDLQRYREGAFEGHE
jgi:hypothetical protein